MARLSGEWTTIAMCVPVSAGTAMSEDSSGDELLDPVIERAAQSAATDDDEVMRLDEDFPRAHGHGMPPSGGAGMGVGRLPGMRVVATRSLLIRSNDLR